MQQQKEKITIARAKITTATTIITTAKMSAVPVLYTKMEITLTCSVKQI